MTWTKEVNPFGDNRTPSLIGLSYEDGETIVPIAADPATGAILTEGASASSINATVFQGTNPWIVAGNVTIYGNVTANVVVSQVFQGGAPWTVIGTVDQGSTPWVVSGTVVIGAGGSGVTTVYQGGAPWLVNASLVGPTVNTILASVANGQNLTANPILGQYFNTSPVISSTATYSYFPLQIDSSGNLKDSMGTALSSSIDSISAVITSTITLAVGNTLQVLATVTQGTNPWLVNASVIGQQTVTASIAGVPSVLATVTQGTTPWVVDATVYGQLNVVTTVVTVLQGTSPWLVNASIVGLQGVNATYSAPWSLTATVGNTVNVIDVPTTSGGVSAFQGNLSATVVTLKASAGQIYGYHIFNVLATQVYVNFYNAATATVGTTNPFLQLGIPASGGAVYGMDIGIAFSTAIMMSATASIGGVGAVSPGVSVNVYYD